MKVSYEDRWRGGRLLADCSESHLSFFLPLLFWVVNCGTLRRLPSNIWESFSHQMMERQPSITPLNPSPLLKTARPHMCTPLAARSGANYQEAPLLCCKPTWGNLTSLDSLPTEQLLSCRNMHFCAPFPACPTWEEICGCFTSPGVWLLLPCPPQSIISPL